MPWRGRISVIDVSSTAQELLASRRARHAAFPPRPQDCALRAAVRKQNIWRQRLLRRLIRSNERRDAVALAEVFGGGVPKKLLPRGGCGLRPRLASGGLSSRREPQSRLFAMAPSPGRPVRRSRSRIAANLAQAAMPEASPGPVRWCGVSRSLAFDQYMRAGAIFLAISPRRAMGMPSHRQRRGHRGRKCPRQS